MIYDVLIIGAGVSGALIAREISRLDLKIAILEKSNDVAMGASKANSGIVHGGFDALPGTVKAKMNVRGTALMPEVCRELAVPFKNNGSLVLAFSDEDRQMLEELRGRAEANGVKGVSIIGPDEVRELEPNVSGDVVAALRCDSSGIVCPYELTIAATENARSNGAELFRNSPVTGISFDAEDNGGAFTVVTPDRSFKARLVINAAGCFAGEVAGMIGDDSLTITPRRGEYYLLDKSAGTLVSRTIFQCPNKYGKGVLVTPSVDGNLLIGPNNYAVEDGDDVATTPEGLDFVATLGAKSVPKASVRDCITSFSGNRAHEEGNDFVIAPSKVNKYFINVAGIESPGLSSAPAIAEYVAAMAAETLGAAKKTGFDPVRPEPFRFRHATDEQRAEAIAKDPAYGRIICRCENVTEGEIIDAIRAPGGALDVDGVKRRTRAGMGRCQGGFCGSKVVELLAREAGVEMNEITKFGGGSKLLYEETKRGEG